MLTDRKIGVLMGGLSAEREVSLRTGGAVAAALRGLGYGVVEIDAGRDVCRAIKDEGVGVAFIALHGGVGEDGSIQGLLEVMGIPYTGSGVGASALAMDKAMSKALFAARGLDVPRHQVIDREEQAGEIAFRPPFVIKPSREGSSVGVSIVKNASDVEAAINRALAFPGPAIVEEYIKGKEINIGVLCDEVLGGVEIRPRLEFYSYEAKYTPGMTEYILPPELDGDTYERAKAAGIEAHRALGCRGATRVDLIVDEAGTPYVIEVNTIPGMTETSLLPKIAGQAGVGFAVLVERILHEALERGKGA